MPIELTNRVFTVAGSHPYDLVKWEKTPVKITDENGNILYELNDAEFPSTWSKTARKITANKYFRESRDSKEKEASLQETIGRVVNFITDKGVQYGYFEDRSESFYIYAAELTHILLHQIAAFNSPVWFNAGIPGVEKPLLSACFINQVEDNMESILDLAKTEGLIFKEGAGSGVNFSNLRASTESIRGGGTASGPVSFMQGYDAFANIIMSGGRTRRSARMCSLDADHPDIEKFISCKNEQEVIVEKLIKGGMSARFNDLEGAYSWAKHQTGNNSVRVTNEFMERVRQHLYYGKKEKWNLINRADGSIARTIDVGELFTKIAECAHGCGDPALQFHDTINGMNCCSSDFSIEASNPCFSGEMQISTPEGKITFAEAAKLEKLKLLNDDKQPVNGRVWCTGVKDTIKITFPTKTKKPPIICTPNHLFKLADHTECEAKNLKRKRLYQPYTLKTSFEKEAFLAGFIQGDGATGRLRQENFAGLEVYFSGKDSDIAEMYGQPAGRWYSNEAYKIAKDWKLSSNTLPTRELPTDIPEDKLRDFLSGLYSANGSIIKDYRIALKTSCNSLAEKLISLLYSLGINAYKTINKKRKVKFSNGIYECKESYDVNITQYNSLIAFAEKISFGQRYKQEALKRVLANRATMVENVKANGKTEVYDFYIPNTHWGIVEDVSAHNCSEFFWVNNSACNLSSINLVKFMREDNTFDTKMFKHVVRMLIIAQDIIVEAASYPTKDIEMNSLKYRPLGLGYANLGGLLMRWGIPYDSDKGREIAASITSLMTAQAYITSAEVAAVKGPFSAYEYNKVSMEEVLSKHRAFTKKIPESHLQLIAYKAWGEALAAGFGKKKEEGSGFRNAQTTVLAPTGCVVGDTLVLSSEGLLPISELGAVSGDKWQDIKIKVRQETQVTDATKFFVNGEDSVTTITTKKGHEITCTLKHNLRVLDTEGNYSWKEACKIQPGEYIALKLGGHESLLADKEYQPLTNIETTHALSTILNLPKVLDEVTAEILGFYQGNGYTKKTGGLHFVICNDYYDLVDHFNIWATNTGITPTLEQRGGCFVWNAFSRVLRPWFKLNNFAKNEGNKGKGAASAFIPKTVLGSRTSVLCAFLRGLFEADGTVSLQGKDQIPTVELTTVSSMLATQVQTALESVGIMAYKMAREPGDECYGYRTKYRIRVSGVQSAKLFQEKIGFLSHGKKKKLSDGLNHVNFTQDRLNGVHNQVMINEFYAASAGLPNKVRQDISSRKNGQFSLTWALTLVSVHAQLSKTKIAALKPLVNSKVYFVQVASNISGKQSLTYDLSVPNNNTYIAGGFVSHNTIAFMMDCDTTGIEPAMGLVTYKDMVGGGTLKIAVDAIPEALMALGYSTLVIPKLLQYINDNGYLEGCPDLKEEHLPVFDCAFVAKTRMISVEGHLNMVAAVQPFLSGGVSKTFNMPTTATVEDIKRAYMMAWERGLKGVAIYRQGSKFSEPMRAREVLEAVKENKSIVPTRKELPTTVISIRHVFTVGAHKIHLHCGLDPKTGDIMEIFIRAGGFGSTVGGLLDSYATLFSKSLQYGIPLDVCIKHMEGSNFPPAGVTSNNSIPMVKSIMDYVAQWMKKEFIDKKASPMTLAHPDTENGVSYAPHADDSEISNLGEDTCPKCGHVMVRTGTCTMCKNCSYNSGVCG